MWPFPPNEQKKCIEPPVMAVRWRIVWLDSKGLWLDQETKSPKAEWSVRSTLIKCFSGMRRVRARSQGPGLRRAQDGQWHAAMG